GRSHVEEDALARAVVRRVHDVTVQARRDGGQPLGHAGVVVDAGAVLHVGDPVLEQGEDLRAVVGAQPVPGAEVLVDPHPHPTQPTGARARAPAGRAGWPPRRGAAIAGPSRTEPGSCRWSARPTGLPG